MSTFVPLPCIRGLRIFTLRWESTRLRGTIDITLRGESTRQRGTIDITLRGENLCQILFIPFNTPFLLFFLSFLLICIILLFISFLLQLVIPILLLPIYVVAAKCCGLLVPPFRRASAPRPTQRLQRPPHDAIHELPVLELAARAPPASAPQQRARR